MIHAAKIENSKRLQRVLAFLRSRGERGATTKEILVICNVCTPCINELTAPINGENIETIPEGHTANGENVYRYVWRSSPSAPTVNVVVVPDYVEPPPSGELFRTHRTGVDPERVEYE